MGIVTAVFLYCLPYVLAMVVGIAIARTWSRIPDHSDKKIKKVGKQKTVDAMTESRTSEVENERESLKQARLEACDSGDELDVNENREDGAFNFRDGVHVPFRMAHRYTENEMILKSRQFYEEMNNRRSCRFFSDRAVPLEVIKNIIKTAGTSPSGAHTEPWMYSVIRDRDLKGQIQEIIEEEEKINYEKRMGPKWVNDLKHIGTTYRKPYLSVCSTVIVVFKQVFSYDGDGLRKTHYYHELSTAISVGLLLAAIQNAGLVTCTTTPMNAGPRLRTLLGRESYEKVILLLPVGYPADDAMVPDLHRKPLGDIMDLHDQSD